MTAPTPPKPCKSFSPPLAEAKSRGFRAVGVLADYAEVEEQYEGAVEQFLRDELEYVVVETFDHARAGVALLREEMGGRATFFVDSLRHLNTDKPEIRRFLWRSFLSRLDRLVDFRDPLGPAAKQFLSKLQLPISSRLPRKPNSSPAKIRTYFVTLDGTCYHGRMVSGGRPAKPARSR